MAVWEDPQVQEKILDYLDAQQLLASFTSMGGLARRDGAHCQCRLVEAGKEENLVSCLVDFEEELGFGAAAPQRLRQQGELHVLLGADGQVRDAWLCRGQRC
ncbi:hypothetical protein [Candidatus Igneacidithiobacillus taiwanensis]|uniref:hypothetical protein n=1 Tax=Candidatus Igneacidithiobacillus taiwanensis TaxID=1945924 RepID=UPI00289ADED0|nr:hypothetical protein [Candidatus Igneacidithiobacillus taiwanensis]MCE5360718.1 hypothetical protein [Acidithiobacillus sp.]